MSEPTLGPREASAQKDPPSEPTLPPQPTAPAPRHRGSDEGDSRVPQVREVLVLSVGARLCVLLGVLVLIAAGVAWWLPLERLVPSAPPVPCGTAANPVTAAPAAQLCGALAQREQVLAAGLLAAAVAVTAGGLLVFGAARRTQVAHTVKA
jgi:hypothetical protein